MDEKLIRLARTSSSLLFSGPAGIGKALVARETAGSLLNAPERCLAENHPDLHILRPQGKGALHPIESIREMSQEVAMDPLEGERKVFIIEEAHRMGPPSANALLKTLEEPTPHTLIILVTHHKERLLPTIISRCQTHLFPPHAKLPGYPQEIVACAQGSFGHAARLSDGGLERRQMLLSLKGVDYPTLAQGVEKLSSSLEEAKKVNLKRLRGSLPLEDLPAAARGAKELEMEGRAQVMFLEEVEYLLEELFLTVKSSTAEKAVQEAYEGIERFTKVSACLEGLFLRL